MPAVFSLVSRLYQDHHWASDDLIGPALGYFIDDWFVNQHEQNELRIELSSVYSFAIRLGLN
jgi:hypothetical protein